MQGCSADTCLPGYAVSDLGGQLTAAGVPWTAYMESMPTACDLNTGPGGSSGTTNTTDVTGDYTLTMLPEGSYRVTAAATSYSSQTATVNVTPGGTSTQNFALTAGAGSINGTVRDSVTNAAIAGAMLSYIDTGGRSGNTTTASDGTYTFSNLASGTYTVTASDTGYATQSATSVTVNAGASTTQNFALVPQPGTISGTVTDSVTHAGIVPATVSYTGPGGSGGTTNTTDVNGDYTLTMLPEGSYTVTAAATNHSSQITTVNVTPGATTTQNFALASATHPPIFSDGFESGNFLAWTVTSGLGMETTNTHAGTHAAEGRMNNSSAYAQKLLLSTYNSGYERVWFNIVSQTSQINVLRARTAAGGNLAYVLVLQTSHLLALNVLGNKVATSTTAVAPGSGWHELEMYAAVNGGTPSVEVWLDGTQVTSLTWNGSLGSTPIGGIQIGEASSQTWDVAFDDVAFDTQFLP